MKILCKISKCFLIVSLFLIFIGCSQTGDEENETSVMEALLSAKFWKISSSVRVTTSGNLNEPIASCRLDNLWDYNASGQFFLYPGTNRCTSSEVTTLGEWEIVNNNKGLKITLQNGISYTDEIVFLDETRLQLKYSTGTTAFIETYIPN